MDKIQPKPNDKGIVVPEELIKFIEKKSLASPEVKTMAINLIKSRDSFGVKKYGQHLRTEDGRDDIQDALEELGDLMQYCYKAKLNGKNLRDIYAMTGVLLDIILIKAGAGSSQEK